MSCKFLALKFSLFLSLLLPFAARASVESSLTDVQSELVGRIMPLAAILAFVFAGFSYISGNPNARMHLTMAIIGAAVAFGASSIMAFIQSMIH